MIIGLLTFALLSYFFSQNREWNTPKPINKFPSKTSYFHQLFNNEMSNVWGEQPTTWTLEDNILRGNCSPPYALPVKYILSAEQEVIKSQAFGEIICRCIEADFYATSQEAVFYNKNFVIYLEIASFNVLHVYSNISSPKEVSKFVENFMAILESRST